MDKNDNPTEYRSPTKYVDYFQSQIIERDGQKYGFELVFARPNRTYIHVSGRLGPLVKPFLKDLTKDFLVAV